MKGKKVGVWCCGNENELYAALVKNGIDPKNKDDVTIVNQPFDMNLFLDKQIDAAAAMTYNELAQVLETENPDTGELYSLDDLNVISMEDAGTAMLEDGVFVRGDWIADEANQDVATRFLKASFRGWIYCRDNPEECLQTVLDNGPTLGEGHQRWQLNEINALIWPNETGIGVMDDGAFQQTADIAKQFGVIKAAASPDAYRTDLAEEALGEDHRGRDGRRLGEGDRRGDRGRELGAGGTAGVARGRRPGARPPRGGRRRRRPAAERAAGDDEPRVALLAGAAAGRGAAPSARRSGRRSSGRGRARAARPRGGRR